MNPWTPQNPRANAAPAKWEDFSTEVAGVYPFQSNYLHVHGLYTLEERHARNLIWTARQALFLNKFLLSSSPPFDYISCPPPPQGQTRLVTGQKLHQGALFMYGNPSVQVFCRSLLLCSKDVNNTLEQDDVSSNHKCSSQCCLWITVFQSQRQSV